MEFWEWGIAYDNHGSNGNLFGMEILSLANHSEWVRASGFELRVIPQWSELYGVRIQGAPNEGFQNPCSSILAPGRKSHGRATFPNARTFRIVLGLRCAASKCAEVEFYCAPSATTSKSAVFPLCAQHLYILMSDWTAEEK